MMQAILTQFFAVIACEKHLKPFHILFERVPGARM